RIDALEQRRVGDHTQAATHRFFDRRDRHIMNARTAHRAVVLGTRPIEMDAEAQMLVGFELVELLLERECVRTEIDEALALDEPARELRDLRMKEWLAARDADDGCSAFVGRCEALVDRQMTLQKRLRILDLAAARAREVAAKQRLEHEHEWVSPAACETLLD